MTRRHDGPARRLDDAGAAERVRIREAQHAVLADLLAGYADGELPAESAARVEAHLVGCTRCRRDLAAQIALRDRLAAEALAPAPTTLRDRIVAATAAVPPAPEVLAAAVAAAAPDPASAPGQSWRRRIVAAVVAFAVLVAVGSAALWNGRTSARAGTVAFTSPPTAAAGVPLLAAAVADFRRATAGDLPGRARDLDAVRAAVGFPVEPLRTPGLRLLATWTTTLDGQPAAVLAYRRDDHLVLEYLVPESLFFRHSALRAAAAAHRPLAAVDGAQAVLAWPEAASGALLVSDDTPERLAGSLPALSFGRPVAPPAGARAAAGS